MIHMGAALLIEIGIFSTRWNVAIGGQPFSKSLRGLTVYKMELLGVEGLFQSAALFLLPFVILLTLFWVLPPWPDKEAHLEEPRAASATAAD